MAKLNCKYRIEERETGSADNRVKIYYKGIFLGGYTNNHRYIRTKELSKIEIYSEKEEAVIRQNGFELKTKKNTSDSWWQSSLENKAGQEAIINHFCELIDESRT